MGFLGFRSKKTVPAAPVKAAPNEFKPPMAPSQSAPMMKQAQGALAEDQHSTFEVPDFSEEDLDFDLSTDEFLPTAKEAPNPQPNARVPNDMPQFIMTPREVLKPAAVQKPAVIDEMPPSFDIKQSSRPKVFETPKPVFERIDQEAEDAKEREVFSTPYANKLDIFVEKQDYLMLLIHESKLNDTLKSSGSKLNDVANAMKEEEDQYLALNNTLLDMQRRFVSLDSRIFEKGDK